MIKRINTIMLILLAIVSVGLFRMVASSDTRDTSSADELSAATTLGYRVEPTAMDMQNIYDVLSSYKDFSTFLSLIEAASLAEVFSEKGPFTVFAPTDEAFMKLPAGSIDRLLADREQLARVLAYHVIAADLDSIEIKKLGNAITIQGQTVSFANYAGDLMINDAMIITADITANNGFIHVIDTVIMPR